ncbi:MAG: hypothetical protein WCG10_05140 [Chlamydiota bacterium]
MSISRLKVTTTEVGMLLAHTNKEKSALETSVTQYLGVCREHNRDNWFGYWGSLQLDRSLQYRSFEQSHHFHDEAIKLTNLTESIISTQDVYTKFRATPERQLTLVNRIKELCHKPSFILDQSVKIGILQIVQEMQANPKRSAKEIRSNIEQMVTVVKSVVQNRIDKTIELLTTVSQGLLEEEQEKPELHELRVFLREPGHLKKQELDQKLYYIFTEYFPYCKNLLETTLSYMCKDTRLVHMNKSTLFTREKLLTVMIIKTILGNQIQHQNVFLKSERERCLVPAVPGWNKEFKSKFVSTPQLSVHLLQGYTQRVEDFDVGLIDNEDDLIFKVISGNEEDLRQEVRDFIADIKVLVSTHCFNCNRIFTTCLSQYVSSEFLRGANQHEKSIIQVVVNHFLKDLESPVKQKAAEFKALLIQPSTEDNSTALLKIVVDLYKAGYGLEIKGFLLPLLLKEKSYEFIDSIVGMFLKCESCYEAYDFCLQLPNKEQKERLLKQCLQKLKERSEAFIKEEYFWIYHEDLLKNIVEFYAAGRQKDIENSIECLFSFEFSAEALQAIKRLFDKAECSDYYKDFCSNFAEDLIAEEGSISSI